MWARSVQAAGPCGAASPRLRRPPGAHRSADALERDERVPGVRLRHRHQRPTDPGRLRPHAVPADREPGQPRCAWSRPRSCRRTATPARSWPRCSPASPARWNSDAGAPRRAAGAAAADGGQRGAASGGPPGRGHDPDRGRGRGRRGRGRPSATVRRPVGGGPGGQRAAPGGAGPYPDQLPCWPRPGWSTPGGQAFLLLLDALVEVLGGEPAQPLAPGTGRVGPRDGTGRRRWSTR